MVEIPTSRDELTEGIANNKWYRAAIVGLGLPIYAISEVVFAASGLAPTAIYLLVISIFYIHIVDARSRDLSERVGSLEAQRDVGRILESEPEVKDQFDQIKDEAFDEGIFIEYSGIEAGHMWEELLKSGDRIYLLLKRPTEAVDADDGQTQMERIKNTIKIRLFDHRQRWSQINVMFYTHPASIRGRRLGGSHLYLGWYNYDESGEGTTVWGHSNPMVYVTEEHQTFDQLDDYFMAMAAARLWNTGTSPEALLEGDPPDWLAEWVNTGDEADRREFIETISPAARFEEEFGIEIEGGDVRGGRSYADRSTAD